ncbi:hypothetical protein [Microbacterium sp. LCT-H2]|uniref:hypothetical protein n=1 Tax=Microbacterium sp. LCT-H2 TaxID=1914306 RepID=UPI0008F4D27A|nr:hypothetical protein [Microbacterium sp. LCT-H2]OIJ34131.1 hypothetical protein BK819_01080 [Microbacterium sp. LCT-H2]
MTSDEPFNFDSVNFVTSDHHCGHARISELAGRPFASVDEMNAVMIERFRPLYEDAGWTVLPEILDGIHHGTRLLACHYPYAGDTTGAERHSSHRPGNTGIPLIHGHTHEHEFGPHGSHEFHIGVDAFGFAPVEFELIDAWLEDLRREEEAIAKLIRRRSAVGDSTPLDELAHRLGVNLDQG